MRGGYQFLGISNSTESHFLNQGNEILAEISHSDYTSNYGIIYIRQLNTYQDGIIALTENVYPFWEGIRRLIPVLCTSLSYNITSWCVKIA